MNIRGIERSDAAELAHLVNEVEATSEYMLWETGERQVTVEKQLKMIEEMSKSSNSTIIVAEVEGSLVGYLFAIGGNAKRNRHSVYIVTGILEKYRGKGIGTKLFTALDEWAKFNGIHRMELTVVTTNEAGTRLYKKSGFEIEGTKRSSLLIDGTYMDEYYMSKLIWGNKK
ncbi:GNAT family N-acetyltransferase [Oceanobacillus luteolus]|uniref:GNAT family N-acetyltransferase n=1 Tax=Oceanobacillus luteolus TaxID=1274358 RepID=A0ABW4HVN3_9BACI|nr:GNAT family N-acetyltransferase [Oceanobacillus luteolus]MCM3741303.1 GNAT family N-acetyltransferase [Oceanobacillus luteolus]